MVLRDLRYMRYNGTIGFYIALLTKEQTADIMQKLDEVIALEGKGLWAISNYETTTPIPDVSGVQITREFLLGQYAND